MHRIRRHLLLPKLILLFKFPHQKEIIKRLPTQPTQDILLYGAINFSPALNGIIKEHNSRVTCKLTPSPWAELSFHRGPTFYSFYKWAFICFPTGAYGIVLSTIHTHYNRSRIISRISEWSLFFSETTY